MAKIMLVDDAAFMRMMIKKLSVQVDITILSRHRMGQKQ